MIEIKPMTQKDNMRVLTQLADMWFDAFGDDDKNPLTEIQACLAADCLAFIAMENRYVAGFAGAIPQYGVTGWELRSLLVDGPCRCKGLGDELLQQTEKAVRERGGVTMYLGINDRNFSTSLGNCDLYVDTFEKIKNIQTLVPEQHPYEFYLRHGYTITGVIPDANGVGKPNILLAKRLV